MGGDIQHVNINYGGLEWPFPAKGDLDLTWNFRNFKGELLECFNKNHGYYVDNY